MSKIVSACLSASRKVFLLRGVDSIKYMHGSVTVDVNKLHKKGLFGAMLNVQGRILADVFIYPSTGPDNEPQLFVDCDASLLETLVQHLNKFKLRSKVTIGLPDQDLNVWQAWNPAGQIDETTVGSLNAKHKLLDERTPMGAVRMLVPAQEKPSSSSASIAEVPEVQYYAYRIINALPEGAVDLPHGKGFPFESNFDYMRGVHFDKGCYLGQEPTARTFFRGATRKRILPVQIGQDLPSTSTLALDASFTSAVPAGSSLLQASDRKSIGSTLTSVHNLALAMVRVPEKEEEMKMLEDLVLDLPEKPLKAKVIKPSWWETRGIGKK